MQVPAAVPQSLFQEDFIELFNRDPLPVPLGGLYLSDEPMNWPDRHQVTPLSFIAGGSHLAFIADGNLELGANHLGFRLSGETGQIALFSGERMMNPESANTGIETM